MSVAAEAPLTTVVVVDGSPFRRRFLQAAVQADPSMTVVAQARTAQEAIELVQRLRPRVVLMHLDRRSLPAIEAIMAESPTPVVAYAVRAVTDPVEAGAALGAGAVTILAEPPMDDAPAWATYARTVRDQVRMAARVRVITHPRGRLRTRTSSTRSNAPARKLVVIGASTGGPNALVDVLGALPAGFPAAVLVVQHIADGFMLGLAEYLADLCPLPVTVGYHGMPLQPGSVVLAPDGANTLVGPSLRLSCEPPPPGQLNVPGIDETFASVARNVGAPAVGVILTGMGRDGAAGLKAMRDRGAMTFGQDQLTSAVYGMPAAAATLGAVRCELSLGEIGPGIVAAVEGRPIRNGAMS